jgi:hypothetical protein
VFLSCTFTVCYPDGATAGTTDLHFEAVTLVITDLSPSLVMLCMLRPLIA